MLCSSSVGQRVWDNVINHPELFAQHQRSLRNLKRSSLREADGAHSSGHERQLEL